MIGGADLERRTTDGRGGPLPRLRITPERPDNYTVTIDNLNAYLAQEDGDDAYILDQQELIDVLASRSDIPSVEILGAYQQIEEELHRRHSFVRAMPYGFPFLIYDTKEQQMLTRPVWAPPHPH